MPLIVRVPGQAPQRSAALVSHRDILPTLAKTLDIRVPEQSLRGRALDAGDADAVLTVAPNGRLGQLTAPDRVVDLRLIWKPNALIVTPIRSTARGPSLDQADDRETWLPALQHFLQPQVIAPQLSLVDSAACARGCR